MHRRSFLATSLAASAGLGIAAPVWSQTPAPGRAPTPPDTAVPPGKLNYGIERDGSDIGKHVMDVVRDGDRTIVTSQTNIAVRVVLITAYRFEQTAREVWRGGRLVEFTSTTNDDGTRTQVQAAAKDNALTVIADGKTATLPPTVMPAASLWNPRLVQQSRLFDTADGRSLNVSVQFLGEETLKIKGANVAAKRFSFKGDVQRELWYDQNWTPVQAYLIRPKDTSVVKFILT
jgi:hypothetical protein